MSDASSFWQLFLNTALDGINNKNDVLIAFIHFFLSKNDFRCIGIGDDRTLAAADQDSASELLPVGWNQMEGVYKLRYINDEKLYILTALPSEGIMITNLVSADNLNISNVTFNVEETVTGTRPANTTLAGAKAIIKDFNTATDKLKTELLEPVYKGSQRGTATQTDCRPTAPPRQPPNRPHSPTFNPILPDYRGGGIIPGVGSGDLDPLGRGGPGSLFEPPRFNPRGGSFPGPLGFVPPGARFDPYGPPIGGRQRFEPNPDHERPPGYDDMFM